MSEVPLYMYTFICACGLGVAGGGGRKWGGEYPPLPFCKDVRRFFFLTEDTSVCVSFFSMTSSEGSRCESDPLGAVRLARHKWPGG